MAVKSLLRAPASTINILICSVRYLEHDSNRPLLPLYLKLGAQSSTTLPVLYPTGDFCLICYHFHFTLGYIEEESSSLQEDST